MFIVSDPNQRIYDNRVSLARLGVEVRGRSTRLTVSYRTTQEILAWAVRMLAGRPAQGLDDTPDTLAGYHSPMRGRRPVVRSFVSWRDELDALVDRVRHWQSAGVEPSAIGIAARTRPALPAFAPHCETPACGTAATACTSPPCTA